LAVVALASTFLLGSLPSGRPELEKGIRQVTEGDFEGALLTLDSLARDLAARKPPPKELVSAYVWLGAAYAGLDQEALASAKLEQALRLDPALALSPQEFPAKLLRLFEAARQRVTEEARLKKVAGAKPRSKGLLIGGLGAAAAGGIALAVKPGERKNSPPTARISVFPDGKGLPGITQMTFTAEASDAEGDPLSFEWEFGDGTTASGSPTSHIYPTVWPVVSRTYAVQLTVRDGLSTATAGTSVTISTLNGLWNVAPPTSNGIVTYQADQGAPAYLSGIAMLSNGESIRAGSTVVHPRRVRLEFGDCVPSFFEGEAGPNLDTIQGVYTCSPGSGRRCSGCVGQPQPLVLRR
jgi:hypothetical protein